MQEGSLAALIRLARPRSVGCTDAPDVLAVGLPVLGIGNRVAPLCVGRAPAVLEVVESVLTHVSVANAAEVHPHVGVLMAEQRTEVEICLVVERAPVLVVGVG